MEGECYILKRSHTLLIVCILHVHVGGGVTSEESEMDDSNGKGISPTYKLLTVTFSPIRE